MANSVVKVTDVTDDMLNDSLLLLVGEDGTVTPDQETVETYLNSKSGPTNIQIMHIDKADPKGIDVTVDNVIYMPGEYSSNTLQGSQIKNQDMDEVARNLYNFKLDHDYTPLKSPGRSSSPSEEVDELAKTLSILHGSDDSEKKAETVDKRNENSNRKCTKAKKINIISSVTIPPLAVTAADIASKDAGTSVVPSVAATGVNVTAPAPKGRAKIKTSLPPVKPAVKTPKIKKVTKKVVEEKGSDSDDYEDDEDFDVEMEDDENDSDFDIEDEIGKVKQPIKRTNRRRTKSESKSTPVKTPRTPKAKLKVEPSPKIEKKEEKEEKPPEKPPETKPESQETKVPEKKAPKKEKKPPKPIPDDFALFSTPDIIRRVGGKDPVTPTAETPTTPKATSKTTPDLHTWTPKTLKPPLESQGESPKTAKPAKIGQEVPQQSDIANTPKPAKIDVTPTPKPATIDVATTPKPAKITQESRSNSESGTPSSTKHHRHSLDNKDKERHVSQRRHSLEKKHKDRRLSEETKVKKIHSLEEKLARSNSSSSSIDSKVSEGTLRVFKVYGSPSKSETRLVHDILDTIPTPQEIRSIIMPEEPKPYQTPTSSELSSSTVTNVEPASLNLDGSGLDLDQSILDNINNDDVISEDILYQVAQQLVSNTELQNAIDKGINEGVLDTSSIQDALDIPQQMSESSEEPPSNIIKEGTQIVRPDGRVVVIPPIERPTTRSRNKKKNEAKLPFKRPKKGNNKKKGRSIHKPLDDEHVSGNELDSSNDEKEESEDDPNKLWCICNQPHNNRFMICCDTCEEWYHGKCVNINKAMGQQMESEGKEWICLFCKDPSLRRPMAAARRIRKASRNSRASTDSNNSSSKLAEVTSPSTSVPCVVCQKPARKNSIYCSETCILAHAQGIERVVVFERTTGDMITGSRAPSAANLEQWLKEHPGYEVARSAAKVKKSPSTPRPFTQSKLKLVKNDHGEGVSLAVQQKGTNIGVLKHAPKTVSIPPKTLKVFKVFTKNANAHGKEAKTKLIQPQPIPAVRPAVPSPPVKVKHTVQSLLSPKIPKVKEKKVEKEKPQKDKPMPSKAPKVRQQQPPQPEPAAPKEENIRENVQKTVAEQLMVRLKGAEDLKLTEDEVKNISIEIESQLYKCFGDTGQKYRNKYRSLMFNIKDTKNQTLWRRICEKSISPYELVRLSPDDMASQELAMWREREAKHQLDMIKKSELELLSCNRQYVLKTHKGEQVLEDGRPDKVDNTEVIKSLTEGSALDSGEKEKRDNSKEKDRDRKSTSKHSHKDRDRDRKSSKDRKDKDHRSHRSSSRDKDKSRKRSRSRDRNKHSERKKDKRSRSRSRDRHRKSSHKSSRHKRQHSHAISSADKLDKKSKEIWDNLVDNKIVPPLEDGLWEHVPQEDVTQGTAPAADSDSDHEPSSTVTIPTPPRSQESDEQQPMSQSSNDSKASSIEKPKEVIEPEERSMSPVPKPSSMLLWKGTIRMIDVAQISITAQEVSGDCYGLGKELPPNLDIVGRISPETVWDYIGKMRCSNSKMISLIRLSAVNMEEQMPYLALYSYLSSRNRLGVVKSPNKGVKDFYVLPLAAQKPIPQALLPISGPGFEESRPALLLGIIVRDKRKRPYTETILPPVVVHKKTKVEVVIVPPATSSVPPARSYTPPPMPAAPSAATVVPKGDPRLSKLPLPPPEEAVVDDGGDEPYSPEDSDPDATTPPPPVLAPTPALVPPLPTEPLVIPEPPTEEEPYPAIPGLGETSGLPSTKLDLQRQMEELNKKIEMQKSEITSITQNIATASGSEIGTSALASIALPSNLQQILDSIKTIGAVSTAEAHATTTANNTDSIASPGTTKNDLTIPLMIPKTFTRPLSNAFGTKMDVSSDTIPLNLPNKSKFKAPPVQSSPKGERTGSLLSTLSEDDLIKKAAEMLNEDDTTTKRKIDVTSISAPELDVIPSSPKKAKVDSDIYLPPVPGVED